MGLNKYIAWRFINVDGLIISLALLEVNSLSAKKLELNWNIDKPKVLAAFNKKRMLGALAENEYYMDFQKRHVFDSKSLASRFLVRFIFTSNYDYLPFIP